MRDAGPADARSVDVGPPDVFIVLPDAGSVCSPAWAVCNTDADCFAWGARVGPPGTFFSSMCVSFHCTMGIAGCWTHDGNTHCQCAPGIECLFGQLCVSDVPGGPTRCVEACDGDGVHLDAGPAADWDGGRCDGRGMTWGTACTAEIDAECQRRATERAYGRYGYSRCVTLPGGTQSACADGDYCSDGPCRCTATRECGGDYEVCASDTPDGPHYCRPICAR